MTRILVTGGAGFIGSNLVHLLLQDPTARVTTLDKLTYAGRMSNLEGADARRHRFVRGDVVRATDVAEAAAGCEAVMHLAAESHVDRSIAGSAPFLATNVEGTRIILEECRRRDLRLLHVSTDEVYGSIERGKFREDDALDPSSPYSASKAAADLLALAYRRTYGLDVRITRCTNNYGPRQHPEKLIPKFIGLALAGRPLTLYGDGKARRDWIHVDDHCRALVVALISGKAGQIYNVAGGSEHTNLDVATRILKALGKPVDLIQHVADRPGHDRRYAVDDRKMRALHWRPRQSFGSALTATVEWYRRHPVRLRA